MSKRYFSTEKFQRDVLFRASCYDGLLRIKRYEGVALSLWEDCFKTAIQLQFPDIPFDTIYKGQPLRERISSFACFDDVADLIDKISGEFAAEYSGKDLSVLIDELVALKQAEIKESHVNEKNMIAQEVPTV